MPKRSPELSETDLKRLLNNSKRTKRVTVALGFPKGVVIRLAPGKLSSAPVYLCHRPGPGESVRYLPLGSYPELSLAELQEAAMKARTDKEKGVDLIAARKQAKAEQNAAKAAAIAEAVRIATGKREAKTMADACELYFTYAANRNNVKASTEEWTNSLIRRTILPFWENRLVAEVTRKEIKAWHESMVATKFQADSSIRVLSKIFNLTLDEDPPWRVNNPASRIPKHVKARENRRKRTLSQAERKALSRTLASMVGLDPVPADIIRALQISAMRLSECLSLRHSEIAWDEPTWDEERGEQVDEPTGWITKTEHKTSRTSGPKTIRITSQLGKIIKPQPRRAGCDWVFPSPLNPAPGEALGHFVGLQKVWERIRKQVTKDEAELVLAGEKKKSEAVNIEDVHLHDLRRTALTITYGDAGQTLEALAEVAGHADTATTKKHYVHLETQKKRIGAELIAAKIAEDM